MSKRLQTAELTWSDGSPESSRFGDIYFNRDGGVAETEHVFIKANRLRERFARHRGHFVIAETGFGTGLNFLCARALWLSTVQRTEQQLHFISCEKYPLSIEDLRQALAAFPRFEDGVRQLIDAYPAAVEGFYTLRLDGGRILLTLLFGDAVQQLARLQARVDSWFLDGFAPARNPDLWTPELFEQIARLSHTGTRFATFTAAGIVRRGLQSAGFRVEKLPGFGRKRDMLAGEMTDAPTESSSMPAALPLWAHPPQSPGNNSPRLPVIVIGAGLAGASTARALAEKGVPVQVLERHAEPAQEGSGNAQGALYAKLPANPTDHSQFHLSGLEYTRAVLTPLLEQHPGLGGLCGVLQLALNDREQARQDDVLAADNYPETLVRGVDREEAEQLSGLKTGAQGLFFPTAGWVSPAGLCRVLLDHPLIQCCFNHPVHDIDHDGVHWQIQSHERFQARSLVVCCATSSRSLGPLSWLPLKPIRGQTTQADAPVSLPGLSTVVCGEGYISPAQQGRYCFGASFKVGDEALEVREEEHAHNLHILTRALPDLGLALTERPRTGRAALRCSTPDYLPIAGPVPDLEGYVERYVKLRDDARWPLTEPPAYLPGLYINTGHGSKGLISGPITGELIAALITGTPSPLPAALQRIIHPGRFIIKNLIRKSL